jgi:hypothetical protein
MLGSMRAAMHASGAVASQIGRTVGWLLGGALIFLAVSAPGTAHADGVTKAGSVLLYFDGAAATPADVRPRLNGVAERRYEIRYAPKNDIAQYDPVAPITWALRFGTVEDPKTRVRWLRDIRVVLLDNSEMECTASTSSLVVGADKIGFDDEPVRAGMMVNVSVSCTRRRDRYNVTCGGAVIADGTSPGGCNATRVAEPGK